MGFKGLDRGFFAYALPVVLLQLIWVVMSIQISGSENYTGLYAWIILFALLIISRIRAGFPFTFESAGSAFGVTDKVTQYILYLGIILAVINIISYFVDPGGFIRQVPLLESSPQAEHAVLGITMINIAILIAFIYQYRVGLSGVLITMGAVGAAMFFSSLLVASVTYPNDGAPLLALFITLNFIISMTV